jgi:ATP-binding cassette subfamily B protein
MRARPGRIRRTLRAIRASLIWRLLASQKRLLGFGLLTFVVTIATTLQVTNLTRVMVDDGLIAQAIPLEDFMGPIIVFATLAAVSQFFNGWTLERIAYEVEYDLRTAIYRRVHAADLTTLDALASGQLITRSLTDLDLVQRFMRVFPTFATGIPALIAMSAYLLALNPIMGFFAIIALPIDLWLLNRFRHRLWGLSWAELNERAEITAAIDEPVRGIRVMRVFGREEEERGKVAAVALRTYRLAMSRYRMLARYDIAMKAIPVGFQAVTLLIGARLVADGSLTLGTFMIAFQLLGLMMLGAQVLDELASVWQYFRSAQDRLDEVLELGGEADGGSRSVRPGSTTLRFEQVTVDFDEHRVLEDIELVVAAGSTVVVRGAPSSGKTTLASVAAGLVQPTSGSVTFGDVPLGELHAAERRRSIRVVSEEATLFAASVRENLELAVDGRADADALAAALWAAHADDFVAESGGLDVSVGDRGLTLSGGQRQRLSLARALVEPPGLLVLDDALSAVNPSMEVEILERVRSRFPELAILFISRRSGASTVADQVYELPDPDLSRPSMQSMRAEEAVLGGSMSAVSDVLQGFVLTDEAPAIPERVVTDDAPTRFSRALSPFRLLALGALFALAVQSLARLGPEIMFGAVADLVESGDTGAMDLRAVSLVGIGIVGALAAYVYRVMSQQLAQGLSYLLRRRVFQRLSKLGIDYYDRELPGEVAARVVFDLDQVHQFAQRSSLMMFTNLGQLVIGFAILGVIAPAVLPVAGALAIALVVLACIQVPITTRVFNRVRDELGRVTAKLEEDFGARHVIRGYGAVDRQIARFDEAAHRLRRARGRLAIVTTAFGDVAQWLGQVAAALVLWRSGNLVLAGSISVGSAIMLRLLAQTSTMPISLLGRYFQEFLQVRVAWQRLAQPFEVPILPVERADARPCGDVRGEIEFDHVSFAYPHTGRPILHDVDVRIPAQKVTTLVGYTGAGKSSVAKLLMRTYDPDAGAVRVDGVDIREFDLADFRRRIGVVPQDAFVFRGTVRSNIAYGKPDATDDEIRRAARAVGAGALLEALPGGYDHPVSEEGKNLTAAQRQLIALARAWMVEPDVLVLDEATSCLDAGLERAVLAAVGALGCTTLMVTHRENVVAISDLVIVLDAGRVAEIGSPNELIGSGGAYDHLWVAEPIVDDPPLSPVPATAAVGEGER